MLMYFIFATDDEIRQIIDGWSIGRGHHLFFPLNDQTSADRAGGTHWFVFTVCMYLPIVYSLYIYIDIVYRL